MVTVKEEIIEFESILTMNLSILSNVPETKTSHLILDIITIIY